MTTIAALFRLDLLHLAALTALHPLATPCLALSGSAAGAPDADYSAFESHDLHVIPSAATLTFEHSYTWWGNRRKLRVAARPNVTLSAQHVPARCQRARTVLLGPLTPDDVNCLSFIHQPGMLLIPELVNSVSFHGRSVLFWLHFPGREPIDGRP